MEKKADLRVRRTRKLIRETFEKMICEMSYEQITVKALTERAGISRKTFYLHYPDLDDLLRDFQSEMADEFVARTASLRRPQDMDKITREFFQHSERLGKLAETLICSGSYSYIGGRITANIMDRTWGADEGASGTDSDRMAIISTFVAQGTLAIYRRWIMDGKKIPLEELIELATRLICGGLDSLP